MKKTLTVKRSQPTMKDVAQEAGVALGTVSKVFNGIPVGESCRITMAETSVDLLPTKDRSNITALICLPVSYAPDGTTRE